jgi:hypothetical protein
MCLSAHLAELTHNQTYIDAAVLAANFIHDQLLLSSLVSRVLDISNCVIDNTTLSSYSGAAIEGFMVLANVTNDVRWYNL